jgi:exosortase A-associated hydrolase 1
LIVERALHIRVGADRVLGILHGAPSQTADLGVVVVVGGPQYRVGSHRQFALLARDLAAHGIPVLRFDCRGMGDGEGDTRSFDAIDEDIAAAIDSMTDAAAGVRRVVLWGLCDGASAALIYAPSDARVAGLVLLNPWVRTEAGLARSHLWTYYPRRLVSRQFWQKLLRRPGAFAESAAGLADTLRRSRTGAGGRGDGDGGTSGCEHFLTRMLTAARQFRGPVKVLLSGNDITAGEFRALLKADRRWRKAFTRRGASIDELPEANHTFSSAEWRNWAARKSREFVRAL